MQNLHVQGFLMPPWRVQGWHLSSWLHGGLHFLTKGMLPKGMGYQVGNEVSEPEGGICQPFKKRWRKRKEKESTNNLERYPSLLLSIWNMLGSEHTWKRKSPWSDFFDRKVWLFLWGVKVGMWERSPEDLSPKRQDEIQWYFPLLGLFFFYIKESICQGRRHRFDRLIPGLGRSPEEGNVSQLQHSCLGNPMDGGGWRATVHGVTKSWTWLSLNTSAHIHIHRYIFPLSWLKKASWFLERHWIYFCNQVYF